MECIIFHNLCLLSDDPLFQACIYSKASPAMPTAPIAHDATFTFDAAPGVAAGVVPLPDALGLCPLWSSLDVPLGKPEMFC